MHRVDPRFRLVLGVGFTAAVLAGLGVLLGLPWLSGVAIAVLLACGLMAIAALRVTQQRLAADLSSIGTRLDALSERSSTPAPTLDIGELRAVLRAELQEALDADLANVTDVVGVESARLGERLRADLDLTSQQSQADLAALLERATRESAEQTQAVNGLYARHQPRTAIRRLGAPGPTPRQTLDLLEVVHRSAARSAIGLSLGDAACWLGYAVEATAGTATVLVADAATGTWLTDELARHRLETTITVATAPMRPVSLPHHYQPWHDVSTLPDDATGFDLVLAGPAVDGARSLLPLLPLLADRLAPGALVALATGATADTRHLVGAWQASHGVRVEPSLSTADVTVLRLP